MTGHTNYFFWGGHCPLYTPSQTESVFVPTESADSADLALESASFLLTLDLMMDCTCSSFVVWWTVNLDSGCDFFHSPGRSPARRSYLLPHDFSFG